MPVSSFVIAVLAFFAIVLVAEPSIPSIVDSFLAMFPEFVDPSKKTLADPLAALHEHQRDNAKDDEADEILEHALQNLVLRVLADRNEHPKHMVLAALK